MKSFSSTWPLIAGLIGAAVLAGCNSDNNSTPPLAGAFRIANGITDTDSNGLGARLNDVFEYSGISFGTGSGINNPPIGSFPADFDINGSSFTVDNVEVSHDNLSSVFTYGSVGGATANGFTAYESLVSPGGGQFAVQPLHSAYQESLVVATLSYYFVPAGSGSIGSATPVLAAFAMSEPAVALPAGNYEIIVTNGATVVYDSGASAAGIALPPSGTDVLQIAALDAPGAPDGSTISLLMLDNGGGTTALLNNAH
jgi:hypothetical protein